MGVSGVTGLFSGVFFQDEEVVVFRDIRPAATHHYLVATKEHIRDAKQLTGQHVQLGRFKFTINSQ